MVDNYFKVHTVVCDCEQSCAVHDRGGYCVLCELLDENLLVLVQLQGACVSQNVSAYAAPGL